MILCYSIKVESRINKAKILSHKIGVLKLPVSKISSKEALTNSGKEKKCFSDRVTGAGDSNSKKSTDDDSVGIACCFLEKNNKYIKRNPKKIYLNFG